MCTTVPAWARAASGPAGGLGLFLVPDAIRRPRHRFEARLATWAGGIDPDRNLYRFLDTLGSSNSGGYSNPRLDRMLENGRKALTEKARRTLYRAAQQLILSERPTIYLFHPVRYAAVDTERVRGVDFFPDTQIRPAFAQLT